MQWTWIAILTGYEKVLNGLQCGIISSSVHIFKTYFWAIPTPYYHLPPLPPNSNQFMPAVELRMPFVDARQSGTKVNYFVFKAYFSNSSAHSCCLLLILRRLNIMKSKITAVWSHCVLFIFLMLFCFVLFFKLNAPLLALTDFLPLHVALCKSGGTIQRMHI